MSEHAIRCYSIVLRLWRLVHSKFRAASQGWTSSLSDQVADTTMLRCQEPSMNSSGYKVRSMYGEFLYPPKLIT